MKKIIRIQRFEIYFFVFVGFYLLGSFIKEYEPYSKDPLPVPASSPTPIKFLGTVHPLTSSPARTRMPRPVRSTATTARKAGVSRW
jgi:hypothetical protein